MSSPIPQLNDEGVWLEFDRLIADANAQLSQLFEKIAQDLFTHEDLIQAARRMSHLGFKRRYSALDSNFVNGMAEIEDEDQKRLWHRAMLLAAMIETRRLPFFAGLPLLVRHYQLRSFRRILRNETDLEQGWYSYEWDRYRKDLGLTTLALIASGNRVSDLTSGIHGRALLQGPLFQFPAKLGYILRHGGFGPYIQTHIHDSQIDRVEGLERQENWRCCVLLFKSIPSLKGLMSISWMEDPQLEWISPRLYESGKIAFENGAKRFRLGQHPEATKNALAASRRRQELFKQGLYQPENYMRLWSSAAMIKWSRSIEVPDDQPLLEVDH